MKVDEFKQKLHDIGARYDEVDDEIIVESSNRLTYSSFYILDTDVMTFKLRPSNNPVVIKSLEFNDNEIIINKEYHLDINPNRR